MTLLSRFRLWYWQQLGNLLALAERRVFAWRAAYEARSPVMRVALGDDDRPDAIATYTAVAKRGLKTYHEFLDDDDWVHWCGVCGRKLQIVRPGHYQCNYCDSKKAELKNG